MQNKIFLHATHSVLHSSIPPSNCRPLSGVLRFTRETMIALTTNIKSLQWRRETDREPEQPHASTTDDVQCNFSIMRVLSGSHFTVHTANTIGTKCVWSFQNEYTLLCPPTTTLTVIRGFMREIGLPSASLGTRQWEQLSQLMYGRVTLPTPGAKSPRMTFYKITAELPPPSSTVNPLTID